jgi:hypothetical protein
MAMASPVITTISPVAAIDPLAEPPFEQPAGPVTDGLIAAGVPHGSPEEARGDCGESGIKHTLQKIEAPPDHSLGIASALFRIKQGLDNSPQRKAQKPDRNNRSKQAAEGMGEELRKNVFCIREAMQ